MSPSKLNVFMWHLQSIFTADTRIEGGGATELSPGPSEKGLGWGDIEDFSKTNHVNKFQNGFYKRCVRKNFLKFLNLLNFINN